MNNSEDLQQVRGNKEPKWALLINDTLVWSPQQIVSETVLRQQASIGDKEVLVRDHNSPDDVVIAKGSKIDLAEGNVFYTLDESEVGERGKCQEPAKLAYIVDDRHEIVTREKQSRSLASLLSSHALNPDSLRWSKIGPPPADTDEGLALVRAFETDDAEAPILVSSVQDEVKQFVRERIESDHLFHEGLSPAHSILMTGAPGRECGKIKPDLVAFGGCEQMPMHLVSTVAGKRVYDCGTSYASPVAASLGAQAAHGFERASALLSRALLIHSARHPGGEPDDHLGHGCIPNSVDELLVCDDDVVTIVFQGDILPTKIVRLPIPLPSGLDLPGKVELTWTVAGLAPIDPNHPGDYTCGCLEDTFYPHSEMFSYSPPKGTKASPRTLHIDRDKAAITGLVGAGWKKSLFPVSASGNKYRGEAARRALDCKWEPTVRRSISKLSSTIKDPFLTLHAIGRHDVNDRFDYVAIVSIRAKKFSGDLYTAVRTRYPALAPIRLRTEAEIRVAI